MKNSFFVLLLLTVSIVAMSSCSKENPANLLEPSGSGSQPLTFEEEVNAVLDGSLSQDDFLNGIGYEESPHVTCVTCEEQDSLLIIEFLTTAWRNSNYEGYLPSNWFIHEQYQPQTGSWNLFGNLHKTGTFCGMPITAFYAFDKNANDERCNFHLCVLQRDGEIVRYPVDADGSFIQIFPNEGIDGPDDIIGLHLSGLIAEEMTLNGTIPEDGDVHDGDVEMIELLDTAGQFSFCIPEEFQEYPVAFSDGTFRRFLALFSDEGPKIVRWKQKHDIDADADPIHLVLSPEDSMDLEALEVVEFSTSWQNADFQRTFFYEEQDDAGEYFYPATFVGNIIALVPLEYLDDSDETECP